MNANEATSYIHSSIYCAIKQIITTRFSPNEKYLYNCWNSIKHGFKQHSGFQGSRDRSFSLFPLKVYFAAVPTCLTI